MIVRNKLRDQVVTEVIELIDRSGLRPGDELPPERELTAQMGVSRTVVREALTALEMQGLLELTPGRRPRVRLEYERALGETLGLAMREDLDRILQLAEVRRIVEADAAALAAERAEPQDVAAMQEAIDTMREHLADPVGWVDSDVAFHEALLLATKNEVLVSMFRPVAQMLQRSRAVTTEVRRRPTSTAARQHQEILDRIAARDIEGARAASERHMTETVEDVRQLAIASGGAFAARYLPAPVDETND
jgi:GntR family transcriptional repressor for pyruvate dehydrogenase complex